MIDTAVSSVSNKTGLPIGGAQATEDFSSVQDEYQRNSNWWAVFASFDLKGCKPSAAWIANRLALPPSLVNKALDGLVRLGFLKRSGELFQQIENRDFVKFDFNDVSREESIERHALVSQQILNQLDGTQRLAFDHRCFAADDVNLRQLYSDVESAINAAYERSRANQTSTRGNSRVLKISFTAVDVLTQASPSKENSAINVAVSELSGDLP